MEIKRATCIKTLDMIYGFFYCYYILVTILLFFLLYYFLLHQNRTKHFANYIIKVLAICLYASVNKYQVFHSSSGHVK